MVNFKRTTRTGLLYVMPLVLFVAVFMVYPVFYNILTSLFDWNGISKSKDFIGLRNYSDLFGDPVFWITVKNFFLFAFFTVFTQAVLGIVLAFMFSRKFYGSDFARSVIFMPAMLSSIIMGTIFFRLLDPNVGFLRIPLKTLGISAPLSNPDLAFWVIILVNIWQWTGYSMSLYFGSIVSLPTELFEAAKVDGVGNVKLLTKIIVPLVRGTTYNLTIIGIIGALKQYDLVASLTGGGPANSTQTFTTYLYDAAFTNYKQGYASAIAFIMFLIALVVTVIQLRMYNSKDAG